MKKRLFLGLVALTGAVVLASCQEDKGNDKPTTVETGKTETTTQNVESDERYDIYLLAKNAGYTGTYEEWLDSIRGASVELRISDGYFQMKYSNSNEWQNLISLSELKGKDGTNGTNGENGTDGREIELSTNTEYILYKYSNETEWHNLIAIDLLKGNGTVGADGKSAYQLAQELGYTGSLTEWLDSLNGTNGDNGKDGKEVELSADTENLLWRYKGDTTWKVLLPLASITGEKGDDGKSAYEIYIKYHPQSNLTEEGWLESLKATVNEEKYTVSFDLDGGIGNIPDQELTVGKTPVVPLNPTKDGYKFHGWFYEGKKWDFTRDYNPNDMTLTAVWAKEYQTVHLEYCDDYEYDPADFENPNAVEAEGFYLTFDIEYGTPIPTPTKEGYDFIGWYDQYDGTKYLNANFTEETYLTAKWKAKTYTVTIVDYKTNETLKISSAKYGRKVELLDGAYVYSYEYNGENHNFISEYQLDVAEDLVIIAKGFSLSSYNEAMFSDAEREKFNSELAGTYDIELWIDDNYDLSDITRIQLEAFKSLYPNIKLNCNITYKNPRDTITELTNGNETDIFTFRYDGAFDEAIKHDYLSTLPEDIANHVTENNVLCAVDKIKKEDQLLAYPYSWGMVSFMYYDKSVVDPAHVESLEQIIEDCEKTGKDICFETSNPYYSSSFMYATGCKSDWHFDSVFGKLTGYTDTFSTPEGLIALRGLQKLSNYKNYVDSSLVSEFENNAAVVVSGSWGEKEARMALGENFGVCKLPTFTVDGKTYQLNSSLSPNPRYLGVKPQTDSKKETVCHLLAEFLTSAYCQEGRFDNFEIAPTSKAVYQLEENASDEVQKTIYQQLEYASYYNLHDYWWDVAKDLFMKTASQKEENDSLLIAYLNEYDSRIKEIAGNVSNSNEHNEIIFSVIGFFSAEGIEWNEDIDMTLDSDNVTWVSRKINAKKGDQFVVRANHRYDLCYGFDENHNPCSDSGLQNIVIEEDGTIVVTFINGDSKSLYYRYVD